MINGIDYHGHGPLLIVANVVTIFSQIIPHVGEIASVLAIIVNLIALYKVLFTKRSD